MPSLFPLVSFLITLLLAGSVCIQAQQTVKDTDGNPVEIGKEYFIQPVNSGGPLVPTPTSLSSFCPLAITQIPIPFIWGPPIRFGNIWSGSKQTIVATDTDVTIEFRSNNWPVCNEFSKFLAINGSLKEPLILTGGNPNRPNSWFKVKTGGSANTYELTSWVESVGTKPGPLFGAPQLVLTSDNSKTLFVKFQKLGGATSTSTSTSTHVEKLGLRMFPF